MQFDSPTAFLVSRLIAGFGFTALVVTVPAAMSRAKNHKAKNIGLVMWGGYLPIGIAIGMLIPTICGWDWATSFFVHGVFCAVAAAISFFTNRVNLTIQEQNASALSIIADKNILYLGITFLLFAALFLMIITLIPTSLREIPDIYEHQIGLASALISATSGITSI